MIQGGVTVNNTSASFQHLDSVSENEWPSAISATCSRNLETSKIRPLLPVVKLAEKQTYPPFDSPIVQGLVVKVQDMLTVDGTGTNAVYRRIQDAGGIHEYFHFDGNVVLSSIMRDRMIRGFTSEQYCEIIEALRPDYYITPDGETYLKERKLSAYETSRIERETEFLINSCLKAKPIGLVKGSTLMQVKEHAESMLEMDVGLFAFHAGEFLNRGNSYSKARAFEFARSIRRMVPWLLIYGIGSRRYIERFEYADGFVTQCHFTEAFRGYIYRYGKRRPLSSGSIREAITNNLTDLQICVNTFDWPGPLDCWLQDSDTTGREEKSNR